MDYYHPVMKLPDDVVSPKDPLWAPFTHVIFKLTSEWDIMVNAVETGFGSNTDPQLNKLKVIEFMLANFAECWAKRKLIDPEEVSNFLKLTMDDFFHVDISNNGYPLAKVLVKIYSECLQNNTTGIDYVLARDKTQHIQVKERSNLKETKEETKTLKQTIKQESCTEVTVDNTDKIVEMVSEDMSKVTIVQTATSAQASALDEQDGGWQTVVKKKRNKKQQQHTPLS